MTAPEDRFQPLAHFVQTEYREVPEWAVLCPGPSLGRWDEFKAPLDQRIAVNNAIEHPRAGVWWAKCDLPKTVSDASWAAAGRIRPWLITQEHQGKFWDPHRHFVPNIYLAEELDAKRPYPFSFTMLCAIQFAFWRGGREINLYGCDLEGTGYWGSRPTVQEWHNGKRWRREAAMLKTLTDNLESRGCAVVRH